MLQYYRITDLVVGMDSFGRTVQQAEAYRIAENPTADILISSDWQALQKRQPHLSDEDCEYLSTGASFYYQLLNFDGLVLHSSAVVVGGRAYLFSAPCGTGKSTHTALWCKEFADERAFILNDDKPALRLIDGKWYVYGTPWSGKHDCSVNTRVPLGGICVLCRGEENKIEPFTGASVIAALIEQTTRPRNPEQMQKMLSLLDRLITGAPIWRLECTPEPEAAHVARCAMEGFYAEK